MNTIDDLISEREDFSNELMKLPVKATNTFRALVNIYVLSCLDGESKKISEQRKRIDDYVFKLEKNYHIESTQFTRILNSIQGYYSQHKIRDEYMKR